MKRAIAPLRLMRFDTAKWRLAFGVLVLAPLLVGQALRTRRVTPRLPEAAGERSGTQGEGPPLRLLILGDSAAAGVGTAHQDDALAGQLVQWLAPHFEVSWRVLATTGDRTADARKKLAQDDARADVVVTSLGVNDVTALATVSAFVTELSALAALLRERGARVLLFSGLPPMHAFPALPQPLRWALGAQARRFDAGLAAWCAQHDDCVHLPLGDLADLSMMASDGFHPGPAVYAHWAALAADAIRQRFAPAR